MYESEGKMYYAAMFWSDVGIKCGAMFGQGGYVLCAVGSVMYGTSVRGQTVEGAGLLVKVKVSFFSARRSSREGSCFYQSAFFVGVRVLPPGMVKGRATNSSLKRRFDGILLGLAFIFGGVGGL
jgi:hypothetical protein